MGRKPMKLGSIQFEKKGDAYDHVRITRKRYVASGPGSEYDNADSAATLSWLKQVHPEWQPDWAEARLVVLEAESNYAHGVNGADGLVLHLVWGDGRKRPVSLRPSPKKHVANVKQAFRQSLVHDVPVRALVCEWELGDEGQCEGRLDRHHVDHTFDELVEMFAEANSLELQTIQVAKADDEFGHWQFVNQNIRIAWAWFHNQHAEYEVLCFRHHQIAHGNQVAK